MNYSSLSTDELNARIRSGDDEAALWAGQHLEMLIRKRDTEMGAEYKRGYDKGRDEAIERIREKIDDYEANE